MQEIIDEANIGRTTFYAHFETKDDLLKTLCEELFGHIMDSAFECTHTHGLYSNATVPESIFCHLLQHLQENDNNILGLLSCESNDIFLRYFKSCLSELIRTQFEDSIMQKKVMYLLIFSSIISPAASLIWFYGGLMAA